MNGSRRPCLGVIPSALLRCAADGVPAWCVPRREVTPPPRSRSGDQDESTRTLIGRLKEDGCLPLARSLDVAVQGLVFGILQGPHVLRIDQKKSPAGGILIWSSFAYKSAMNFAEQLYGHLVFAMGKYILTIMTVSHCSWQSVVNRSNGFFLPSCCDMTRKSSRC